MRNQGTLPTQHAQAVKKITNEIFDGAMDYSLIEKISYFGIVPILASYASWESVKFYMDVGGEGTKYLPFGNFSKEFGGQAAFWSNFSLNWFFIMDTLITARNAYYEYKMTKKLGIAPSVGKIAAKLVIAGILSAAAGTVMALISRESTHNKYGTYNGIETGLVNTLLNFIGSMALEAFIIFSLLKMKDYLSHYIYQKTGLEEEEDDLNLTVSTKWIGEQLSQKTDEIKKATNDELLCLKTVAGYLNKVLASDETSRLIGNASQESSSKVATAFTWMLHAFMQYCDKLSLYGFWKDTMASLAKEPFNFSTGTANFSGTLIFIPFLSLTMHVVYHTTKDQIIGLPKTAWKKTKVFYEKPEWTGATAITLTAIGIAGALTLTGYFFAYVSSNSGLELNAEFGWNDWWNVTPTAIGTTIFNGFGFMGIFMAAYAITMPFLLYSADEREVLNRHEQSIRFFNNNPKAVDQLAKEERIGLEPMVMVI